MRIPRLPLAVAGAVLLLAACGSEDEEPQTSPVASESPSQVPVAPQASETPSENDAPDGEVTTLRFLVRGDNIPDGGGEPGAFGDAELTIKPQSEELCYVVEIDLETVTGMHVHRGAEGEAGPVEVALETPVGGVADNCSVVETALLEEMLANPGQFYVQLHTSSHPDGAARGQLNDQA